ncbi:MAG TPA: EamA family transporter [Actinomycetota bacterium]|nr:EamA family transporter [Actinomycetota bacterium]
MSDDAHPSTAKVWTILGALYFVWGTTYLGIEKVNETVPTLLGAAARFLFAGAVLFAWTSVRTGERTRPRQWRAAGIVGIFLLLGGNALVAVSENMGTPTGLVSLIIALIPLWLAFFDRVVFRAAPLGWKVVVGLIGGFGGAALLVSGSAGAGVPVGGMLVAVAATLCWTVGSLYARTAPLPKAPLLGSGMQQMVGGAVILAVALAIGEGADLDVRAVSGSSWLGLAWLIVAGSFVGFSAYLWLLRNVRTTLVSTYAYVNPIVAVTLGVIVLDEALTGRMFLSGAIVLASVAMIVSSSGAATRAPGDEVEGSVEAGIAEPDVRSGSGGAEERRAQLEREV